MKDTLQEALAAQAAWQAKWPKYCKTCEGGGTIYWEERHDPGYPGEPMSEPCGSCIDLEICPRCAEITFVPNEEDEIPLKCSACGWEVENPDFLPGVPEDGPQIDLEY